MNVPSLASAQARHLRTAAVALVLLASAGCDGPNPAAELKRFDQLLLAACRAYPGALECFPDASAEFRRIRADINRGALTLDPKALDECIATGEPLVADDVERFTPNESCRRLWVGHTSDGDACDLNRSCERASFCKRDNPNDDPDLGELGCGVCAVRGDVGALCTGDGFDGSRSDCRPGLACFGHACVALGRVGEECGVGCDDSSVCKNDRCVARGAAAVGDSCETTAECSTQLCENDFCFEPGGEGARCNGPRQCAGGLTCDRSGAVGGACRPAHIGDLCLPPSEGGADCADDGTACITEDRGVDSYCRSVVQLQTGDACVSGVPTQLDAPVLLCPDSDVCGSDNTCVTVVERGGACSNDDQCSKGMECLDGTCQPWGLLGERCASHCLRGTCREHLCVTPEVGTPCTTVAFADPCGEHICLPVNGVSGPEECAPQNPVCDFAPTCDDARRCVNGTCEASCIVAP